MEHVGIGQEHAGAVPDPIALVFGGVPIVGLDARWGDGGRGSGSGSVDTGAGGEAPEGEKLVLRERLGREDEEGLFMCCVVPCRGGSEIRLR